MKTYLYVLVFIFSALPAIAQEIDANHFTTYEGTLGGSAVRLSLNRSESDSLKGSYCYKKYDRKILLRGKISGSEITLTEFLNGKTNGYFKGRLVTETYNFFIGQWTNAQSQKTVSFKLQMESVSPGSSYDYGTLYSDIHNGDLTDDAVEAFMKKVKESILNGDKNWLAAYIKYPLTTKVSGKTKKIKNSKELISNFSLIFHKDFLEAVQAGCVCNMFCTYRGVMLGNGEIWIMGKSVENNTKTRLEIIAINN